MRHVSTTFAKYFCVLLATVSLGSAVHGGEAWPLRRNIDLSSGFGDYRPDHFHTGVDIRTGGVIGSPILSPVAGYVYRVKMSYTGYGKGLYIMGDDGYLYVYGHLSIFAPKIDHPVRAAQLASKRYYQDLYFPKDSIRIAKGEYLGKTGETGATAPHLHFEKRSGENYPVNPLAHGFDLNDKVAPTFTRIGFKLTDDHSLFSNGSRELFYNVKSAGNGIYKIDSLLYFHRPFGILADCYDRMRAGGMKQSVYKLSVFVDNQLRYEVVLDSLNFDIQSSVNLEYDYDSVAVNDDKLIRVLYSLPGNEFKMSRGTDRGDGVIGLDWKDKPGRHTAKIVAQDNFGNSSEVHFDFIWGPSNNIFNLDSTVATSHKITKFYFTPVAGFEKLGIDSVAVFLNRGNVWGETPQATTELKPDGHLVCTVNAYGTKRVVLKLGAFAGKTLIPDNLFNGLRVYGKEVASLQHQILDDGLLLILNVKAKQGAYARLALYDGDTLLDVLYPEYFSMLQYRCFVPPSKKYPHITKIGYAITRDTTVPLAYVDTINIYRIGGEKDQPIKLGDSTTIHFHGKDFFAPRFVEMTHWAVMGRSKYGLNSDYFEISPPAFPCKQDFVIDMLLQKHPILSPKTGICWRDKKAKKWVWLENAIDSSAYSVEAKAEGGGLFAALFDMVPPTIEKLDLRDRVHYTNPTMTISCVLKDTLSGILDDRNITMKLDGQWLIPQYDPVTGICKTTPNEPMSNGMHHFGIVVTDQAGNTTERYLNFYMKAKK